MCTDHARAASGPVVATHRPIPLRRRSPMFSRRRLLYRAGLGTAGVALLAACGSDGGGTGASTASSVSPPTDAPDSDDTMPPEPTTSAADQVDSDQAASAVAELRLEWVELGFVSAYVLARGREAAVVDTGTPGSGPAILQALAALGLQPADVRHIVLTHDHGDHAGGLGELESEMTNATVSAGPGDVESVTTALPLQQVGDGDEVFGMGVVLTPGHTPGSISVFDADTGLLVAGDAINGDGSGGLLGPNEQFSSDMPTALASVGALAALNPTTAAFGHGGAPVSGDLGAQLAALAAG